MFSALLWFSLASTVSGSLRRCAGPDHILIRHAEEPRDKQNPHLSNAVSARRAAGVVHQHGHSHDAVRPAGRRVLPPGQRRTVRGSEPGDSGPPGAAPPSAGADAVISAGSMPRWRR